MHTTALHCMLGIDGGVESGIKGNIQARHSVRCFRPLRDLDSEETVSANVYNFAQTCLFNVRMCIILGKEEKLKMKSAAALLLVLAVTCSAAPDAYTPWSQPASGPAMLQGRNYYLGVPVVQQSNQGDQCVQQKGRALSKHCTLYITSFIHAPRNIIAVCKSDMNDCRTWVEELLEPTFRTLTNIHLHFISRVDYHFCV